MKEKHKWVRLDGDNGWQIVIPDFDTKPHSTEPPDKLKKLELAWLECPCKPKVNYLDKVIVHNSFQDDERITEAITDLTKIKGINLYLRY